MTSHVRLAIGAALLCATAAVSAATPQPVESFARRPQMHGVSISADGHYVAFLSGAEDETVLMTFDRNTPGSSFKRVTASEPDKFDIGWCRFANARRMLCGLYGNLRGKKYAEPPFTRMFAIDASGTAYKALDLSSGTDGNLLATTTSMRNLNMNQGAQNDRSEESMTTRTGEGAGGSVTNNAAGNYGNSYRPDRQDDVIDLTPDDENSVLIQLDDDRDWFGSIYQLNIYDGKRTLRMDENPPIRHFITDGHGNPRIGWGTEGVDTYYYARLDGDTAWRKLGATRAFTETKRLRPIGIAADANTAYAYGDFEGHQGIWSVDLADKREPQLLFSHKLVDAGEPILRTDRRLLGVRYDVERPYVWYADPKLRDLIDRLERLYPGRVHDIVDSTDDEKTLLVRSYSDVDEGTYFVYDVAKDRLSKLGASYPELDQKTLGTMTNIIYSAKDNTEIPGYLTVPTGAERKNLPLIVMPHDGPVARDSWKFSYLRTFLANRGYAVLQMNYRGSSGFGQKWQLDAHQDWGGLTYSDIQDATQWAIKEGIADPKRICILGAGFGGYAALLGAVRNSDTYKCAVSIAGIADLEMQKDHAVITGNRELRRQQIGTDAEKLKRDSPLQNVAQISIPVLLIHGSKDWQVQEDHSKALAKAMDKNNKDYEMVLIKGANHEFERKSDRVTLLKEVEAFLAKNLGAGS